MAKKGQGAVGAAEKSRDTLFRDFAIAGAGMLIFQIASFFSEAVSWDYGVSVKRFALALLLTVGALGCILWMNVLLWRLKSLTGDRTLRRYWIYCSVMAVLCWFCRNLDGGGAVPMFIALLSTPLGSVGAIPALVSGVVRYRTCCGSCLVFCLAEVLYHHRLLCRHMAEHVGDGMNTAEEPVVANL